MTFPEWTEAQTDEQDSIQFLRLNELRDSISELLFPYLITITPYFRMTSWLTWVFTKLEGDMQQDTMTTRDYVNGSLRYYGVFATADVLFSKAQGTYHRGPIGVLALRNRLGLIDGNTVDFRHPSFSKPQDPTPIYRSSLIAMNLLEEKRQPISRGRFQSILLPTKTGKELAKTFEAKWSELVNPKEFVREMKWSISRLEKLGKLIDLQGLAAKDRESRLLQDAARSAMKYPDVYDDFVTIVLETVNACDKAGYKSSSSDIAKAALYRSIPTPEEENIQIKLEDTQATALLAYHELHTHMSFGADTILDGLVHLSKNKPGGISKQEIWVESSKRLELETEQSKKITILYNEIKKSFRSYSGKYQTGYPISFGKFGFESIRKKISDSEDYFQRIAYGAIILLQSAGCQELFKSEWLIKLLPYHRKVLSSYAILEEYQSLPPNAQIKDWVQSVIDLIIQKHDDVAESKGLYAKRFDYRDGKLFYRADAEFGEQRGRLANAVLWLSDIGVIGIDQGLFTARK